MKTMRYENIERYLHEVLGLSLSVKPWAAGASLPYFLQDAYEFASIEVIGAPYVLMLERQRTRGASEVRKHMNIFAATTEAVGVYVASTLSSHERKRLIEQRVPFIVPGNQLYLPDLGIDLREYFRRSLAPPDKALSPATQALLISALLKPWKDEVHPAELGEQLGYTTMTLSRAVKELESAELAVVVGVGRERWLRFEDPPQAIWRKASTLLRDPVRKSVWIFPDPAMQAQTRLAGESALADATLLAEPAHPVYALSAEQWKMAQQQGMRPLPVPEPGACLWQIWRYNPCIDPDARSVDPLSLILSLRKEPDERVQQALTEFEEHLPW